MGTMMVVSTRTMMLRTRRRRMAVDGWCQLGELPAPPAHVTQSDPGDQPGLHSTILTMQRTFNLVNLPCTMQHCNTALSVHNALFTQSDGGSMSRHSMHFSIWSIYKRLHTLQHTKDYIQYNYIYIFTIQFG